MIAEVAVEARAYSPLEAVAVVLAIAYLILAIRQNIWCWLCAALSTAMYMYLFVEAKLYMESLLNLFYLAMAVYGWQVWRKGGGERDELPVSTWPFRVHVSAIASIFLLAAGTGFLLERYSDAVYPYLDSLTTFAAIWTTFLVAHKVLENWWYWLVIDAVSAAIYWSRDLELTALLFVLYLVLIPIGLVRWTRSWRAQAAT
jgi:nicotinamide mononucleotide transporter